MRLIDADALKEYFFRPYSNEESYSNIDIARIIDDQPTQPNASNTLNALDTVYRQAAIDAVETIGFDFSDSGLSAAEIEEVCEAIGEVRQEWSRRIKRLPSAQPVDKDINVPTNDTISRQAAINIVDSETVSTNPEHFKSSEKFIKFMDNADIASFGKWQWANGFNTALVATKVQLKKLPSTQPERKWIPCSNPPKHHRDVLVKGTEAIGNVIVHKVMQWDVDTWRPTNYAPSIRWEEWSEI